MTESAVKTWSVVGKPRCEPLAFVSSSDFRVRRDRDNDTQHVWESPCCTLYCLDWKHRNVCFVETSTSEFHLEYPFYYQAQREQAQRLHAMSFSTFHEMVERYSPQMPRLLMIQSTGRSGSTLVTRILGHFDNCCSFSEPDFYTQLLEFRGSPTEKHRWLRNGTRFLCRHHAAARVAVLKFRSFVMELANDLQRVFPDAVTLFLYRDVKAYVRSAMQSFRYRGSPLYWFDLLRSLPICRTALRIALHCNRRRLHQYIPKAADYSAHESSTLVQLACLY